MRGGGMNKKQDKTTVELAKKVLLDFYKKGTGKTPMAAAIIVILGELERLEKIKEVK